MGKPGGPVSSAAGPEPRALLASLRRRWLVATLLGLLLGGGAAAAVWFLMPTTYYVFAELRVREKPDAILYAARDPSVFNTYKQGWMRRVFHPELLTAALRELSGKDRPQIIPEDEDDIEWLQENLEVTSPGVEFIRIALRGDRPQDQVRLVKAIAETVKADYRDEEERRFLARRKHLESVLREVEADLRTKQGQIEQLAEILHTGDREVLSEQQQAAVQFLGQLRQQHASIRLKLMDAQARLAAHETHSATREETAAPADADANAEEAPAGLQAAADAGGAATDPLPAGSDSVPVSSHLVQAEVDESEEVRDLEARRLQLTEKLRKIRGRVRAEDSHWIRQFEEELAATEALLQETRERLRPHVAERIRQRMAAADESTVAQIKRQIEVLEQQKQTIEAELAQFETNTQTVGKKSFELERHREEAQSLETTAERISEELKRLDIEQKAEPRIEVYQEPRLPSGPELARKAKFASLAGLGAFALLVGGIVLCDVQARRISSLDEVVDGLSLRVLGSLPIMPRSLVNGKRPASRGRPSALRGLWKESIDSTRTMLLRESSDESLKMIMVVSAMGGEGKTTLACHLATSLAQAGRRTLLIDADLRRPSVHRVYGLPLSPGFSEAIRGETPLDEAIRPAHVPELSVLSAGAVDALALRLLAKGESRAIFAQLRAQFDFVIIDSAPVLPVSDALIIGQHADAALFAIRRDVSRFGKVASACERLSMLGIPLLGAVVIGLDESVYGKRYDTRARAEGAFTRVAS